MESAILMSFILPPSIIRNSCPKLLLSNEVQYNDGIGIRLDIPKYTGSDYFYDKLRELITFGCHILTSL